MIKKLMARLRPAAREGATPSGATVAAPAGAQPPIRERLAALRDDLRRRIQRAPAGPAEEPATASPAGTQGPVADAPPPGMSAAGAPAAPLPALRSMAQWMTLAGLVAASGLVCWTMVGAWGLVSTGHALEQQRFVAPTLSQFPPLAYTRLLPQNRLNPDLQRVLSPQEDRLLRAVTNIATFENARAEPILRATRAVVQAVVPGSAAARAGVEPGDLIRQVGGRDAGFVWDVYKYATERPLRLLELAVQRGEQALSLTLTLPEDERFDMSNHGLLFAVPDNVRFIGKTDTDRIAGHLRNADVDLQPPEWQRSYVEGLFALSNELVSNLTTVNSAAFSASNYLRSEELLVWYRGRFAEVLSNHRLAVERLRSRQAQVLVQLGWSLLADGLALLLVLGLAVRARWSA